VIEIPVHGGRARATASSSPQVWSLPVENSRAGIGLHGPEGAGADIDALVRLRKIWAWPRLICSGFDLNLGQAWVSFCT
jgi:hypothetical protein